LGVIIRRLQEDDVVENFDCEDEVLNNYLKKHAWNNQQKISIGVTYVVVDESAPSIVLGYFTLATSAVPRDSFPKKQVRGLPAYDLPLIPLARLAVDYRFGGKGLGPQLLAEAFRISVAVSEQVGCRCIVTDAYQDKVSWYAKYGFIALEGGSENQRTRRLFLDIRTLKATLKS
jgi:predicted GNAT family N-acyltransferase